ncbi:phospholipid/cholesterol/gamma-HCH transport system substrate-binding protein [Limimonas halophila]|uniref:Phospholipid/cholesterol/gamma-HCH transport system substrate-binding protein n=1 Tax=Limimonas halophila TaxID=1082479 RepID=A0A1G7MHZ6_9PROT|nr:MlaD family protein [Limimonas halophila]SDF60769.1 phospholipid/cholesterol/gamma-HCH transport system substrate-binding protein [Limimonas halophila]
MRSNRINYIAVGLFVVIVVAAFVAFFAVLSGSTTPRETYFTEYDNVGGVRAGTAVQFQGYRIGEVTAIEPRKRAGRIRFRVEMALERDFPIPRDSTATIATSSLLGGVNIQIRGGDAGETLPPGARIEPGASADLFTAVSNVASQINQLSAGGLEPLLSRVRGAARALSTATEGNAPRIAENLKTATRALAEDGPAIARELRALSRRMNREMLDAETSGDVTRGLDDLAAASEKLNADVLSGENRERIRRSLANLRTFSARFTTLASELRATQAELNTLATNLNDQVEANGDAVRSSVRDLQHTLDTIARHIDAITNNLEGTSRNMNEFTRQIRRDPSLLLRGREGPGAER